MEAPTRIARSCATALVFSANKIFKEGNRESLSVKGFSDKAQKKKIGEFFSRENWSIGKHL